MLDTLDVLGPELARNVNRIDQSLGSDRVELRDSNLDLFRWIRLLVLSIVAVAAVSPRHWSFLAAFQTCA